MRQGLQGLLVRRGQQGLRESREFKAMWGRPGNEGLLEQLGVKESRVLLASPARREQAGRRG